MIQKENKKNPKTVHSCRLSLFKFNVHYSGYFVSQNDKTSQLNLMLNKTQVKLCLKLYYCTLDVCVSRSKLV